MILQPNNTLFNNSHYRCKQWIRETEEDSSHGGNVISYDAL